MLKNIKERAGSNIIERAAKIQGTTVAGLSNHYTNIAVATTGFDPIDKSLCRVRLTISNVYGEKPTQADFRKAIMASYGNVGIVPVEGSFQPVHTAEATVAGSQEYVGLITKGMQTRMVDAAEIMEGGRYASLSSLNNVLMDSVDESVWSLVSNSGGQAVLARQVSEDLNDLVAIARSQDTRKNRNFLQVLVAQPRVAQFARFYNPGTKTIDHGYVCGRDTAGDIVIASRLMDDLINVDDRMVITATNIHREDAELMIHKELNRKGVKCPSFLIAGMKAQRAESKLGFGVTTAAATSETPLDSESVSYTNLRDYYRQVFAYAPEYYNEIEKIIDSHGF